MKKTSKTSTEVNRTESAKQDIQKVPDKAYVDFTKKEKEQFRVSSLLWKQEHHNNKSQQIGPLYVVFEQKEYCELNKTQVPVCRRYQDGHIGSTYISAKWLTLQQAETKAKKMKVELKTC